MHYKGLYRSGDRVVFRYTVGSTDVLDSPGLEPDRHFVRAFVLSPAPQPLTLLVAEMDGGRGGVGRDSFASALAGPASGKGANAVAAIEHDGKVSAATVADGITDGKWDVVTQDNKARIHFTVPPHASPIKFTLMFWGGDKGGEFPTVRWRRQGADVTAATKGGPALWPQTVTTKGKLGSPGTSDPKAAAYVVDTLTPPFQNPWNSWIRFGGFDFFPDGKSAALCTWSGDVWIVSGIDDKLEKLTWKRFASGLVPTAGAEDRGRQGLRPRPRPDHPAARPQRRRRGRLLRELQQRRDGHQPASTSSRSTCRPTRRATSTSPRPDR
jgi:hypothetical protein